MKQLLIATMGIAVLLGSAWASAGDYVKNYKEIVDKADWDNMETVTIVMDEFSYDGKFTFESGKPYKLELKNIGEKKHYFTAPKFFKSIATRKAEVEDQAEIKADYFTALEVLPGGQLDLYFVAHHTGDYEVYCTIDDHQEEGMEELLTVE